MILRYSSWFLAILLLTSCRTVKEQELGFSEEPICGGVRRLETYEIGRLAPFKPIHTFEPYSMAYKDLEMPLFTFELVLEGDTLNLYQLLGEDIHVPPIIIEANIQGRTFYETKVTPEGKFTPTVILRGVHPTFDTFQRQFDKRLSEITLPQPPDDTVTLIFSHMLRLD